MVRQQVAHCIRVIFLPIIGLQRKDREIELHFGIAKKGLNNVKHF